MEKDKLVTGILWWKPKQWEKARKISADSNVFDDTYQVWKKSAEEAYIKFHTQEVKVYKKEIELNELVQ